MPAEYFKSTPSPSDIQQNNSNGFLNEIASIKNRILMEADRRYTSGEQGIRYLPWRIRIVVRWAGRMYREIGEVIQDNPELYHDKRAVVGGLKKLCILIPCLIKSIFN